MEVGVQADIFEYVEIEHELSDDIRSKLARFCNVKPEAVIQSIDVETIYDVPNKMLKQRP
jgi:CTP synthase